VAEDGVGEAEADAATAMSLSKPAQLDHHVATDLAILLLTKKKQMLREKPRLKRLILDAFFADGAEVVVDAAIAMSLLKLAQLDHHVATDLVILLMKRPLLKTTPFSDACSDVAETVQKLKLMKSLKILLLSSESRAQGETEVEAATTDATRTRRQKRLKKQKALHVVRSKDDEGHDAPDVWKRPFQTVQLRSLD
jgi:hypothetical protein